MKTMKMLALIIVISIQGFGQSDKPVDSKITDVTVFLNKAQVTREVKTRIEAGKTNLILTGLTSQLDQQSIQVAGKGSFVILGIAHQQNYLNEFNMPKSLKLMKDSLDYFQKQLILEQSQKEILNKEEQMLLSNQKIGGTTQNLTAAELKAMGAPAGLEHQRRVLHPAVLIPRAAGHHQQVRRLGERQRLRLELTPFGVGLRLPRGDVEDRIRGRIDHPHHELAHAAHIGRRRRHRRGR